MKSSILVLKLVIPFYILADVLLYFDLLRPVGFLFKPVTSYLGLPVEAAVALAAGVLLNLYAAIAFAAPLGLGPYEWTILGLFLGVCHSLPVESTIMKKLGIQFLYSLLLRCSMAFIAVVPLFFMPQSWFGETVSGPSTFQQEHYASIQQMLLDSLSDACILSMKIIILISALIFFMDFLKSRNFMNVYARRLPTTFSFLAGQLLGITYGAGILLKESASGNLTPRDTLFVGTFLMVCHSILEDSLLFVLFGANYWIMTLVRLGMAFIVSFLVCRLVPTGKIVRSYNSGA